MTVSRALKTQAQLTPPRYEKRPYAFLHSQTGCEKRGVLQRAQSFCVLVSLAEIKSLS